MEKGGAERGQRQEQQPHAWSAREEKKKSGGDSITELFCLFVLCFLLLGLCVGARVLLWPFLLFFSSRQWDRKDIREGAGWCRALGNMRRTAPACVAVMMRADEAMHGRGTRGEVKRGRCKGRLKRRVRKWGGWRGVEAPVVHMRTARHLFLFAFRLA